MTSKKNSDREYFRIQASVPMDYQTVSKQQMLDSESPFKKSAQVELLEALRKIEVESMQTLRIVSESDRNLAHYLKSLNNRMDLITQIALSVAEENFTPPEYQTVDLSEGGLSFVCKEDLPVDSFLALYLILPPSQSGFVLFSRVSTSDAHEQGFLLGLGFENISSVHRTLLARFIFQAQASQRRDKIQQESF